MADLPEKTKLEELLDELESLVDDMVLEELEGALLRARSEMGVDAA